MKDNVNIYIYIYIYSCIENQNTHFVFSKLFYTNRILPVTMLKNIVQPDSPHMTIEYGTCALHSGIPKATEAHSGLIIYIDFH